MIVVHVTDQGVQHGGPFLASTPVSCFIFTKYVHSLTQVF